LKVVHSSTFTKTCQMNLTVSFFLNVLMNCGISYACMFSVYN